MKEVVLVVDDDDENRSILERFAKLPPDDRIGMRPDRARSTHRLTLESRFDVRTKISMSGIYCIATAAANVGAGVCP